MKKLTRQEIIDILVGCTILGTGGGGSLDDGLDSVEKALAAGHEFQLLDFDEIQADAHYANPYYCGSIVPKGDQSQQRGDEIATSIRALEEFMDVQFHGLVSIEYGGGNTGEMMAAAARTGKFIVDADAAAGPYRSCNSPPIMSQKIPSPPFRWAPPTAIWPSSPTWRMMPGPKLCPAIWPSAPAGWWA